MSLVKSWTLYNKKIYSKCRPLPLPPKSIFFTTRLKASQDFVVIFKYTSIRIKNITLLCRGKLVNGKYNVLATLSQT